MPTTYVDQAYPVDAYQLAVPQVLTVGAITLVDQDDDGTIEPGDTLNGVNITAVYNGDTITVNGTQISGATIYLSGGGRQFVALDGTVLQNGTASASTWVFNSTNFDVGNLAPPCFTPGTRIRAEQGDVPVECLKVGDLVMTLDHGLQPIRWIGRRRVPGTGRFAPVRIRKGAFGNARDLVVSPQHRMLLRGIRAELLFGMDEVLAAACHLEDGAAVMRDPVAEIDYIHIMFDNHEIIYAENALTESFHPGEAILKEDRALREELYGLFPELDPNNGGDRRRPSRPVLSGREARVYSAHLTA